ncbi:MAG: hypothetical protein DCC46_00815 [Armatimonadetes bacterium]|nr:MAG: hypothetical protein DCC46_00815 [Armatimonadota bacterium]
MAELSVMFSVLPEPTAPAQVHLIPMYKTYGEASSERDFFLLARAIALQFFAQIPANRYML